MLAWCTAPTFSHEVTDMSMDMTDLPEDDLLELIGKEITANERGALGRSTKQLIERANRWLKANLEDLKTRICGNATVRVCLESGDNTALIVLQYRLDESRRKAARQKEARQERRAAARKPE
jgi:hypothetical protein